MLYHDERQDGVYEVERQGLPDADNERWRLIKPDSDAGWLSRSGTYYGCDRTRHDVVAELVLGGGVRQLEESGWVRVHDLSRFSCLRPLSVEQRNWLSRRGYDVEAQAG